METEEKKALVISRVDAWVDNFDPTNVDPNNPMHSAIGRYWEDFHTKYQNNTNIDELKESAKGKLKVALKGVMEPGVETGGNFKAIQGAFEGENEGEDQNVSMLKWMLDKTSGFVSGIGGIILSIVSGALSFIPGASEWASNLMDPRDPDIKDAEKSAAGVASLSKSVVVEGVALKFTAEERKFTADHFANEFVGNALPPQSTMQSATAPAVPVKAPEMEKALFDALNKLDGDANDGKVDLAKIAGDDKILTLEELGLDGDDKKDLLDKFKDFANKNKIKFDSDKNEFSLDANTQLPNNVLAAQTR